ncbi:glutamate racemase [Brachyspira alvinipulli]|uniref:glutamate racemase n=1 Tax=Brachyspira alvinipulli TaxID=84379 RepID=UPI0004802260|nr:glutamate racemase [Brachyspira alvinipulli]
MNINSMPIAIFDSGFGGITVLKQLLKILPNENYIYVGDNANIPYGSKSKEEIINLTLKIVDFLVEKKSKIIIIACNTITACTYDILKEKYDTPVIEVISNGVNDAINKTKNNNISIMATEFTVHSNAYIEKINQYNENIKITQIACRDLCPMIESDWYSHSNRFDVLRGYLEKIDSDSDTLILGCTHYPLILEDIKKVLNEKNNNSVKNIIDPALNTSSSIKKYLEENNLLNKDKSNKSEINIYSTGNIEKVEVLINMLLPKEIYNSYNIKHLNL